MTLTSSLVTNLLNQTLEILQNETEIINSNVSSSSMLGTTLTMPPSPPTGPPPTPSASIYSLRLALTIIHLSLVSIGSINLLVILIILIRPYMRSITNVYMISLCLADFIYLANLTLVAATQLNDKSWRFGSFLCTVYHGTETTGKYASVLFVVLLAADRYCAMCKANLCSRYRTYRCAIALSILAWGLSIFAATPLYLFSEVVMLRYRFVNKVQQLCIAKWPSSEAAKWYITFSSVLIFAVPLVLIVFCYYHILNKLREALKGSKRLRRDASSRAPYQRVTRLVLWVVVFHVICWSPFWLFNVFSSVFGLRIQTHFDRIVINFLHLLPYFNCALNPLLYAAHAENFRQAIKSLFMKTMPTSTNDFEESKYFVNKVVKSNQIIKNYNQFSGQSNERLLSSSVIQINQDYSTDFIRFKPSTAPADIVSVLKKTSFNDTTSMYIIGEKTMLMPINDCHNSKSFETFSLMTDKKQIMAEIVSKWSTIPYRPHSNGPNSTKTKEKNGILRHHSSETLTINSHQPFNALTSLNSVAMNLDDENSPECRISSSPSPIFEFDDQQSTDSTANTNNFVPSSELIHAGDVFI